MGGWDAGARAGSGSGRQRGPAAAAPLPAPRAPFALSSRCPPVLPPPHTHTPTPPTPTPTPPCTPSPATPSKNFTICTPTDPKGRQLCAVGGYFTKNKVVIRLVGKRGTSTIPAIGNVAFQGLPTTSLKSSSFYWFLDAHPANPDPPTWSMTQSTILTPAQVTKTKYVVMGVTFDAC